jgi:serine/threonine-protein kinase RIO1
MPGALNKTVKGKKSAKTVKAKTTRRVIKPWTKEDVRMLKAHSKARTPVPKVSKVMKRTVGALRRRAGILGVGLGHRR